MMASTNQEIQEEHPKTRLRPLWLNRDFILLWSGQTVSTIGTGISQFAYPILVLILTRSPALAGLAGAIGSLPYLFLSLPAGALIDRWDRKKVMIICDMCRALNMASVPVALALGHLTVIQLFAVSLIEGIFFVFFNIAQVACLPRVVPTAQLPIASAQNEVTTSISELASPALGGVLFSLRQAYPFLIDAISYAASVLTLFFIKTDFQKERKATQLNLLQQIAEGLSWLWQQPTVRFIAFLTGALNLLTAGSTLIVIVVAQQKGASPPIIGIIFAVASVGSIVGSLIGGTIQSRFSFGTVIIGSCLIIALLFPLYAVMPNPLLLGVVNAGIFLVIPLYNIVQVSYRLALIPDQLQGRVNSVFRMLAFGFIPLGQALTGLSLQALGSVTTILLTALGLVATAGAALLNPHIRNARLPTPVEENEA